MISHSMPNLPNEALGEISEGLEGPVQAVYLISLLGFLVVGAYLVVRQVLIRRELEDAAKVLGDRIRSGSASSEVCSLDHWSRSVTCAPRNLLQDLSCVEDC